MLKFFRWLHLIAILFVILQPTLPATILGHYSIASLGLLIVLFVTFPIMWRAERMFVPIVTRLAALPWRFYWFVWAAICFASFFVWIIPFSNSDSIIIIRLYITFILASLMVTGRPVDSASRWLYWLGPILAIFCIGLGLWVTVYSANLLWTDEGYATAVALSLRVNRSFTPTMFTGGVPFGPIYSLILPVLSVWYAIFGVSVASAHSFIWIVNIAILFCLYQIVRLVMSSLSAWLAVIVTAFPMIASSTLRDVNDWTSLYIGIALWCFTYAQSSGRHWPHLLVGFAAGFSLDGHPNAYRFLPAFFLAYVVEYVIEAKAKKHLFIDRRLFYLVAGGLTGLMAYVGLYGFIDPTGFFGQAKSAGWFSHWFDAPAMLWAQIDVAIRTAPLLFGMALIGLYRALQQPSPLERFVILVGLFTIVIFALSNPTGTFRDYYLSQVWLLWGVLAASSLKGFSETHKLTWGMLAILLLSASVGWLVRQENGAAVQSYNGALMIADQVRLVVPKEARLVAADPFYFRLTDYPNFIEINTGEIAGAYRHTAPLLIWQQIAPNAIVIAHDYPIPPPDSLLTYIKQQNFQIVQCWKNSQIGEVDLYLHAVVNDSPLSAKRCLPM